MGYAQATANGFSLRPLAIFGFCYIISAVIFAISNDFPLVALATVGSATFMALLIVALFKRRWWRTVSIFLACPGVFVFAYLLGLVGVDRYQLAFWVSYPYYHYQVQNGSTREFDWSEGGVFLGGGWQNALVYDPDDVIWKEAARKSSAELYGIGFRELTDLRNSTAENCEMRVLRQLGGNWYLDTLYYGGGFICK